MAAVALLKPTWPTALTHPHQTFRGLEAKKEGTEEVSTAMCSIAGDEL